MASQLLRVKVVQLNNRRRVNLSFVCNSHHDHTGWRSWNFYGLDINQEIIEAQMDALVSRERSVDGVPTSLLDLGFKGKERVAPSFPLECIVFLRFLNI